MFYEWITAEFTETWTMLRDWCGLPLNTLESISEQALSCSWWCKCNFWSLLLFNDLRSPWWASWDGHSMIVVALTSLFVKNFNSYACYVTFFIISVLFCLVCEHETVSINYTSFCCVWVLLLYIMKQQGGNLQNMDSQFHFLFGDFHLCLCYNFLNYSPMVRLQTVRSA